VTKIYTILHFVSVAHWHSAEPETVISRAWLQCPDMAK